MTRSLITLLSVFITHLVYGNAPADTLVGSFTGQFSVSQGQPSYTIPIEVAPGRAGLQPSLALTYQGEHGNGPLGIGWRITGLSQIHRCPRTRAQDGMNRGIQYTDQDAFCLDGQRLLPITSGSAEYRTEIDRHHKIIRQPDHWVIYLKDGLIQTYGQDDNSRIHRGVLPTGQPPATVMTVMTRDNQAFHDTHTWLLGTRTDRHDNRIDFTYDRNQRARDIARITYVGGQIRFHYQQRPDPLTHYHGGGVLVHQHQRLTRISQYTDDQLHRDYRLTYHPQVTGSTRLAQVRACDHQGRCRPAIRFTSASTDLSGPQHAWHTPQSWLHLGGKAFSQRVDVTGDGLPDQLHWQHDHLQVAVNTGTGFAAPRRWTEPASTPYRHWGQCRYDGRYQYCDLDGRYTGRWFRPSKYGGPSCAQACYQDRTRSGLGWDAGDMTRVMDVNDDGRADLVAFAKSGVLVALNRGNAFAAPQSWLSDWGSHHGWQVDQHLRELVDVDGDGLADLIGFKNGVQVSLNTGTDFAAPQVWLDDLDAAHGWQIKQHLRRIVDVNGDQLPDIVGFRDGVQVALNTGTGFTAPTVWLKGFDTARGWQIKQHLRQLVDVNGDGLADVVGFKAGIYVALNTGAGFIEPRPWLASTAMDRNWVLDQHPRQVIDVNGDRLADVVGFRDGVQVSLNTGSGFTEPKTWLNDFNATRGWQAQQARQVIDLNGDGLPELVGIRGGVQVALNRQTPPGELTHIHTPGHTTAITTAALTAGNDYTPDSSTSNTDARVNSGTHNHSPIHHLTATHRVVTRVQHSNGIGGVNTTGYTYQGLQVERHGRGRLGFAAITAHQVEQDRKTISTHHQAFPLTGILATQSHYTGNTQTHMQDHTHAVVPLAGDDASVPRGIVQIHLTHKSQARHDLDGRPIEQVAQTYSDYNAYGQARTQVTTTTAGDQVHTRTTGNTYSHHPATWLIGQLSEQQVTHHRAGVPPITRTRAWSHNELGQVTRETRAPGHVLAQHTDYRYDAHGNRIQVTIGGADTQAAARHTQSTYDQQGLRLMQTTNPLGHTEQYRYDAWGQRVALINASGLTTRWTYDTLGRVVQVHPGDGRKISTTYAWDQSLPQSAWRKTTTASGQAPQVTVYDHQHRIRRQISTGFDGRLIHRDTDYDAHGRVARQSHPYFAGQTRHWITRTHDALDRVIERADQAHTPPHITRTRYQGLTTTDTSALGHDRITVNNGYNQPEQVTDALGGVIRYRYDAVGQLIETIDAEGHAIALTYDELGHKVALDDPNMGQWTYGYNAFGELIEQTDAKGQRTQITYDALGRQVARATPDGSTRWGYDTRQAGQLSEVAQYDPQQQLHHRLGYDYDDRGRLQRVNREVPGQETLSVSHHYDAQGRLIQRIYPHDHQLDYHYNDHGYLSRITSPASLSVDGYSRDRLLQLSQDALEIARQLLDDHINWQAMSEQYRNPGPAIPGRCPHPQAQRPVPGCPGRSGPDPGPAVSALCQPSQPTGRTAPAVQCGVPEPE